VSLDWVTWEHENEDEDQSSTPLNNNIATLIILPGLTGGKIDTYVTNVCMEALKKKFRVVIYQNRVLSDKVVLPEIGYLDLFEDLGEALTLIERKYPDNKIFAIGYSYGANLLTKFLGTKNFFQKNQKKQN